jgi:ABC-2 type transport system permease protein
MSSVGSVTAVPARPRRTVDTRIATVRAVYMIWRRDLVRFWRDRVRVIGALAQPLLFLVILGTGLSSALGGAGGGGFRAGLDYQTFMFPGIIGMAVLFTSIFSGMSIIWDREFGFLKEVLVAPIDRSAVAVGKTLGGATQSTIQGVILLLLAPFVGVKLTPQSVLAMLGLIFCMSFALAGIGVALAARMKSMMGFQFVLNFLVQPAFFLSGALFPVTGLPVWMTALTRVDPLSYGVDPIRRVVLTASGVPEPAVNGLSMTLGGQVVPIWAEVAIMLVFGVVLLAIAVVNFRHQD